MYFTIEASNTERSSGDSTAFYVLDASSRRQAWHKFNRDKSHLMIVRVYPTHEEDLEFALEASDLSKIREGSIVSMGGDIDY